MGTNSNEGDPSRRVVDIDSFVAYLAGYRSDIIATRASNWTKHPDLHALANPERPRPIVGLDETAWVDVPISIQQAISLQYPSATADEDKSINLGLDIPEGYLNITLKSASVVSLGGFRSRSYDKRGELIVPDDGLRLLLRDTQTGSKGSWVISRRPATTSEVEYANSDILRREWSEATEHEDFMAIAKMEEGSRRRKMRVSQKTATLQELQDIVRILERSRGSARWHESLRPVGFDLYAAQ